MTEKEEATTLSRSLSRLEDHLSIVFRAETFVQHFKAAKIILEGLHESVHTVVGHSYFSIDD